MNEKIERELQEIINLYTHSVKKIDETAKSSEERAYGGIVRSEKGDLVVNIGKQLIKIAWEDLGMEENKLSFRHQRIKIPIKREYINKIKSCEVREYIMNNINSMYYEITPDIPVYIDNEFKLYVECKAYTENAMLKRILVDCTLIKHVFPQVKFLLLQLESQLGGDYSDVLKEVHLGSPATHTLLSYFDIELSIITLLEGERKVDKPIHKNEFFKPLKKEALVRAINIIKELLK